MHLLTKRNPDIYDGGILGDELIAIRDHLLRISFREDQCFRRCDVADLPYPALLILIGMQLEDQWPPRGNGDTFPDEGRTIVLSKRFPDIRGRYQHISAVGESIIQVYCRMVVVGNTGNKNAGRFCA